MRKFLVTMAVVVASSRFAMAAPEGAQTPLPDPRLGAIDLGYPAMVRAEAVRPISLPVAVRTIDSSRAFLLDIPESAFVDKRFWPERDAWDRVRNGFAIPDIRSPLVADRERWYAQRKDLVLAMSEKARRYLFHIIEAVERRRMPLELALLPMVESGFEPGALSSAQAAGLWQFIPGTATRYKLKQNEHYDARRDIVASTEAALDYLEFLYGLFNDWHLALAGYNWGEEAVARAVARNQAKGLPTDFDSLVLPEETRLYVPKLLALRNIVLKPESFGVVLADIQNMPYFTSIDVSVSLDLQSVARLANVSADEVRALNPSHKSSAIAGKGKPALLLPVASADAFRDRLAAARSSPASRSLGARARSAVPISVAGGDAPKRM